VEQEEAKWYAIHVLSGHENKVKAYLENEAMHAGLSERIDKIVIPSEDITEMRDGKKTQSHQNHIPRLYACSYGF